MDEFAATCTECREVGTFVLPYAYPLIKTIAHRHWTIDLLSKEIDGTKWRHFLLTNCVVDCWKLTMDVPILDVNVHQLILRDQVVGPGQENLTE